MNIYLIGYRGTGKSTVAPLVASILGSPWTWVDLDVELERHAGRSIATIFAEEGEPAFRNLEEETLQRAATRDFQVVATGGGVIGREVNRQRLQGGWIVWLTASPEVIFRRIHSDDSTRERRPNLTVGGLAEIESLLAQRTPHYQSLADLTLSTNETSAKELAAQIAESFLRSMSTPRTGVSG